MNLLFSATHENGIYNKYPTFWLITILTSSPIITSLFWLSVHTFSLLEARVPTMTTLTMTARVPATSETRPRRSLPSFRMMEDYETTLLCSRPTPSDLLLSLVSGKAAGQRSHWIYGLLFSFYEKNPQSLSMSPAWDDDRWASVCLQELFDIWFFFFFFTLNYAGNVNLKLTLCVKQVNGCSKFYKRDVFLFVCLSPTQLIRERVDT